MNSRTLVTVFGLLLAAFGFVRSTDDEYEEYNLTLTDYTILDNGALEMYRRLVGNRKSDNVALAPIPTLITLFWKYVQEGETELSGFCSTFDTDQDRHRALKKYVASDPGSLHILEFCLKNMYARRDGCSTTERKHAYASFSEDDEEITFWSFRKLIPLAEQWYRDMNIDIKFDRAEFGGRECGIEFEANYFRHTWQQHRRCVLQSKFFLTRDTFENGVRYTRMISDLRYGELPELKAKYIVVPWTNDKNMRPYLNLYVILPDDVDGLSQLETSITDTEVQKMIDETGRSTVEVILPEIRVTRKYHPLPIMKNVSEKANPNQIYDWVTVVGFDAFPATAYRCSSSEESISTENSDVRRFNADHPFLMLFVQKTPLEGRARIYGILGYRAVEQA